jgi:hypothetical protein
MFFYFVVTLTKKFQWAQCGFEGFFKLVWHGTLMWGIFAAQNQATRDNCD